MKFVEAENKFTKEIADLKSQLEAGNISESEYQELVYDLLDAEKIEQNLKVEQVKVATAKLIRAMCKLAGVVPK